MVSWAFLSSNSSTTQHIMTTMSKRGSSIISYYYLKFRCITQILMTLKFYAPPNNVHKPATLSSLSLALSSENRPNSIESKVDILEVLTAHDRVQTY